MGSAIFISTPISRICITDIVRECWAASPYLSIPGKDSPGFRTASAQFSPNGMQ